MTDIDSAIDRLLLAAAALDLPAPLNPAGEAELDALRAAVAPLRLPDDLVRLWRRLQGGPPGMIDRLDLMPVSQAIEFRAHPRRAERAAHDGATNPSGLASWSSTIPTGPAAAPYGRATSAISICGRSRLRWPTWSTPSRRRWSWGSPDPTRLAGSASSNGTTRPGIELKAERWPERRRGQRPDGPLAAALARAPGAGSGATPFRAAPPPPSPPSASSATRGPPRRRSAGRSGGCPGPPKGSGGPLDDGTGRLFVFVPPGADPFRLLQNGTPLELDVRPFDVDDDVGSTFDRSAFEAVATAVRRENP